MTALLQGLLTATAVGALLTLALLALAPLVGRRFAPQWRHWAWLFVALRLAVPVHISLPQAPIQLPALPTGNADMLGVVWVGPSGAAALPPVGGEGITPQNPASTPSQAPAAPAIRPFDWQAVLLALWALGGAGFLGAHLLSYAALVRTVRRRGHYVEDYEGLPVWACPELPSPVLMGFVRPKIVLPPDLTEEVRRFTLLHEATHHHRRDLWFKLLLVWCNALHWFNPMVWLFRRVAAGDLELACDAALLRGRDEAYRRAYGAALVDRAAAGGRAGALTSAFSGTRGSLRRRVIALLDMRPRRAGRLALCLVCGAALLGGSLVACQSWSAPAAQAETIRAMVSFDRTDVDLESPPTELYYTPLQVTDPVTGTGYYSPGTEAMASLPIAADAVYPGFPTTLPNSDVPYHPGVVLRMKQMLSSQLVTLFPAVLTLEDGVVTAIRLISWPQTAELDAPADGDTLLSNFYPEALTAVWMEPSSGINWWRLELSYSFLGPGLEDLDRKDLTYYLEFAEDSPLLELMGINPFEGQFLGVSVSFLTGRNSMTEAEFRQLLSGDTSCTLVVTSAESGAQRRFSMAVSPDKRDGWALLRAYDQGSNTVTLDPIDEFMGGEGLSVYNRSTTGYTHALAPNAALSGEGLTGPADLSDLVYRPESPTPYLLHYQLNEMGQVAFLTAQSRTHVSQPAWLGGLEGDTLTFYLSGRALQPDLEHPHSLPLAPGALEDPEALADQIARSPLVSATLSIAAGQITHVFLP